MILLNKHTENNRNVPKTRVTINISDFHTQNSMTKLRYRVHRLEIKENNIEKTLEKFLNNLEGEAISIIPKIKKGSLPQIYGVTGRVNALMIVEKIS